MKQIRINIHEAKKKKRKRVAVTKQNKYIFILRNTSSLEIYSDSCIITIDRRTKKTNKYKHFRIENFIDNTIYTMWNACKGKIVTRHDANQRPRQQLPTKRYDVKTVDCVMKLVIRRTTHTLTRAYTHEYINVIELTRCVWIDRKKKRNNNVNDTTEASTTSRNWAARSKCKTEKKLSKMRALEKKSKKESSERKELLLNLEILFILFRGLRVYLEAFFSVLSTLCLCFSRSHTYSLFAMPNLYL